MRLATAAAAVELLALIGCGSIEQTEVERFVQEKRRGVVRLVERDGSPRGLAGVVRATHDRVVLLAPEEPTLPFLQLGSERVAVERVGPGLISCPRRWDLQALLPARDLAPGSPVLLLSARAGPWVDGWGAQVQSEPGQPIVLGAVQPAATHEERRTKAPGPDELRGALVFTLEGELVGIVDEVGSEQLAVRGTSDVRAELLPRMPRGEEVLAPEEAALVLRLSLERVEGIPAASDEWGGPDFLLLLEVAGAKLAPIPIGAARGSWTVRVTARGPVRARLVERDVTIADGVVDQEVGLPLDLPELAAEQELVFAPHPAFLGAEPAAWPPGVRLRMLLRAVELDPDRESGPDATPLGAGLTALKRVTSGTVDLEGGDANDLLLIDLEEDMELVCAFLRRDPRASLSLEARTGREQAPALRAAPGPERRLSIARGKFRIGRSLLRVQMLSGPPGPSPWELLVAPANDPDGLVRALFRLLSRETSGQLGAWLDTREFAQELAAALSFEAGLDADTASRAILSELGHRIPLIRNLVLRLLELHFPPAEAALEAIRAEAQKVEGEEGGRISAARTIDAGLLLALRRGAGPRDALVLRLAAGDPDPQIRLRALAVSSRIEEPSLRAVMRELFRNDPSPLVRRAWERSE